MRASMRIGALVLAAYMESVSLHAGAQALPPGCDKLVQAARQTTADRIQAHVPMLDPATALSQVSCIDKILSMRFNFSSWFHFENMFDRLFEALLNKACNAAQSSWNNLLGRIGTSVNVNITLPYGAGGAGVEIGKSYASEQQPSLALPNGKTTASAAGTSGGIMESIRAFWNRIF